MAVACPVAPELIKAVSAGRGGAVAGCWPKSAKTTASEWMGEAIVREQGVLPWKQSRAIFLIPLFFFLFFLFSPFFSLSQIRICYLWPVWPSCCLSALHNLSTGPGTKDACERPDWGTPVGLRLASAGFGGVQVHVAAPK